MLKLIVTLGVFAILLTGAVLARSFILLEWNWNPWEWGWPFRAFVVFLLVLAWAAVIATADDDA